MKIAGIVSEYNPFHNGHAFHIEKTRERDGGCEATHIVAVMSGNFVQRGEPAIVSKFDRAKAALCGGADLVLELPAPWCLSSAEGFAFGAVAMLEALGCVDVISFGSETGDLTPLQKVLDVMDSPRFSSLLKYYLGLGSSFPEARQKAVAEIAGASTADILSTPNNTLGLEYLKALRTLNSSIQPFTIKRYGAEHDGMVPLGNIASATYLRSLLSQDRFTATFPFMPAACATVLSEAATAGRLPANPVYLERAVLSHLRRLSPEQLAAFPTVSEGLENRLHKAVRTASSLSELEQLVKTKRYPLTRVRRLIWNAFLEIPDGYATTQPPYLRILAANSKGKEILSKATHSRIPLLHRASQITDMSDSAKAVWDIETRAGDLYALALETPSPCGLDHTTGLIREM